MSVVDTFLAMGGYARFVWPAYGVATLVLVGMAAHAIVGYRRTRRALEGAQAARRGREGLGRVTPPHPSPSRGGR